MRVSAVWLVLLAASATAAEIATWEAGEPIRSNGLSLARGKLADYAIRKD